MLTFARSRKLLLKQGDKVDEPVSSSDIAHQEVWQGPFELEGLFNLARAINKYRNSQEIVAYLVEKISSLLPVGILGFLLYDENLHLLKAQVPFRGINPEVLETYQTIIQPGSPAEEIWQSGDVIEMDRTQEDQRLNNLGLNQILREAGIFQTVFIPLISRGQKIGYFQVGNKQGGTAFDEKDIRLLTIIACQAALALDNAGLYQKAIDRSGELDLHAQTLTILDSLSSELDGSIDVLEIMGLSVQEFQKVMGSTSASALYFEYATDEEESERNALHNKNFLYKITLQAEYPFREDNNREASFPGSVLPHTALFDRIQETKEIFYVEDVDHEPDLKPIQEFLDRHHTRSLLFVPVFSGGSFRKDALPETHFHGILLAHYDKPYRFNQTKLELARTIGNQVAIALQNARLHQKTRLLSDNLEMRVQQRTAELAYEHQRAEMLIHIITELSVSLDLDKVLQRTLQVLREHLDAERITILIVRPDEKKLHRLASVGYTPQPQDDGSSTTIETDQDLAGWIITNRQSALIDDVQREARWIRTNIDSAQELEDFKREDRAISTIPQHRSAMGVPLMSGAEALGCLLLFHSEAAHFSQDQLELVQAAGNQVAIAVNNAELYRLIRDQAEELGSMLRLQQEETSRSKAILEAVADGVVVTDSNSVIALFNQSAEKILSLERDQVLGKSMEHFSGLFGRATQRWMDTIRSWSKNPMTFQSGETYHEQIVLEDERVISVHLAPVSLQNDFLGTVSIFQDITHQVEVDRLKSEFVATVSHELRTPMTSIKGYVEILLMGAAGALNDQQTRFLQVVRVNSDRLAGLVNDLLDISQIESGRVVLSLMPLYLQDITSQAVADLERRTAGDTKSITITQKFQPSLPRVFGDAGLIRRVLDNLLNNAYQYNLPGGKIVITVRREKGQVRVDIKDTGVGICKEDQERVFERFYRGENPLVLGVAGTGLGLSIVKNLIEMQKGRIWLKSSGKSGKGSTFSFTLPVYKPKLEENQQRISNG